MLSWRFVSLGNKFPRKLTPASERLSSIFKKTWGQVLKDLERETNMLNVRDGSVVIATFHEPYFVRNDGKLRSDAGGPKYPGIVIKFDVPSEDGKSWVPMAFECDRFVDWKANVQAVVGALEALRKIDRYGVSSRGRSHAHYEGYKALPSAAGKVTSREEAAEFIAKHSGQPANSFNDPDVLSSAYKQAAIKLHPDKGGKTEDFVKLQDAYRVMGKS